MFQKFNCFAVAIAAAGLFATGAQAANLLTDGSFESDANYTPQTTAGHTGDQQLLTGSTDLPGWTVVGVGSIGWFSPANTYDISASDGSYSLDLTGDTDGAGGFGGVSQTVNTVAGALYTLTFDLGSDGHYGVPAGIVVSVTGETSQEYLSDAVDPVDGSHNVWSQATYAFVAAGGPTTITLQGSRGRDYIGLDNVVLDGPAGDPGVPEPASWALMIAGFGGAGALLRRKRTAFGTA
ncbi:MAG: DUF642 domain-containing protein [Proteobacteria bacterium]|nr:DUF642 domain-containing protein [Pseudomonadota bacterium]